MAAIEFLHVVFPLVSMVCVVRAHCAHYRSSRDSPLASRCYVSRHRSAKNAKSLILVCRIGQLEAEREKARTWTHTQSGANLAQVDIAAEFGVSRREKARANQYVRCADHARPSRAGRATPPSTASTTGIISRHSPNISAIDSIAVTMLATQLTTGGRCETTR